MFEIVPSALPSTKHELPEQLPELGVGHRLEETRRALLLEQELGHAVDGRRAVALEPVALEQASQLLGAEVREVAGEGEDLPRTAALLREEDAHRVPDLAGHLVDLLAVVDPAAVARDLEEPAPGERSRRGLHLVVLQVDPVVVVEDALDVRPVVVGAYEDHEELHRRLREDAELLRHRRRVLEHLHELRPQLGLLRRGALPAPPEAQELLELRDPFAVQIVSQRKHRVYRSQCRR
ncbi:MAG: hypothetical protein ACYTDY_14060 [Planctomycetota bacterium]|jgi:hypothetical protein